MSLTLNELSTFSVLLSKIDNTQIKGDVWHELVKKFITVPIELMVIDEQKRVLLVYRKDREFDAYHFPGTVVNDWETAYDARLRLVAGEIEGALGITITDPESIGWLETKRGEGEGENPSRHTIALVHLAYFHGTFSPREGAGFFSFDAIPENTLSDHKRFLRRVKQYLEDRKVILGV